MEVSFGMGTWIILLPGSANLLESGEKDSQKKKKKEEGKTGKRVECAEGTKNKKSPQGIPEHSKTHAGQGKCRYSCSYGTQCSN